MRMRQTDENIRLEAIRSNVQGRIFPVGLAHGRVQTPSA